MPSLAYQVVYVQEGKVLSGVLQVSLCQAQDMEVVGVVENLHPCLLAADANHLILADVGQNVFWVRSVANLVLHLKEKSLKRNKI